jgi:hypothetical protein
MILSPRSKRINQGVNDSLNVDYEVSLPAKIIHMKSKRPRSMQRKAAKQKVAKQNEVLEVPKIHEKDCEDLASKFAVQNDSFTDCEEGKSTGCTGSHNVLEFIQIIVLMIPMFYLNLFPENQEIRMHSKEYIELLDLRKENVLLKGKLTTAQKQIDDLIIISAEKSRACSDIIVLSANTITREEYKVYFI